MKSEVHLIAGAVATLTIASFFTATILVELFGSREAIATVKSLIVIKLSTLEKFDSALGKELRLEVA